MATQTSQLIVSLIDRVTGPAKQAAAGIQALQSRVAAAQAANARAMAAMQGQLFGAAAAGYALYRGLSSPTSIAREFESALLDIGQKADLSDKAIADLGKRIRALGPQINQTSGDIAKGVDNLVGFGLDPEKSLGLMGPIGKVATAYKAQIDDVSKAGFSVIDNLKVPLAEAGKAFDVMAQSGKEGAFELKDMAAEFPALTAAAQGLGMTGVTAVGRLSAALQIARKGAATGSEAATNTANLMQKIISPDTTAKFKKAGIDIRAELKKVQETGGDVFEMIAEQITKATKGDVSKIGDFFQDAQVQKFLRPLLANLEEYRRIRDKSLAASGVFDADYARRMLTNEAKTAAFNMRLKELGLTIGNILLPAINSLMDRISPVIRSFESFAETHPKIVGGAIKLAAALIGLRVAAIAARYAFLLMKGGALLAAAPILKIAAGAARLTSAVRGLGLLRAAALFTGIGAAVAGVATAGALIYQNWDGLSAFFQSFGSSFSAAVGPLPDLITPLVNAGARLTEAFTGFFGKFTTERWASWGASAGSAAGSVVAAIMAMPGQIAGLASSLFEIGASSMRGLWDGMKSVVEEMIAWISEIPARVAGSLASLPGTVRTLFGGKGGAPDYTLGSYGSMQSGPATETGSGTFGAMSARTARRAGSSPFGAVKSDLDAVTRKAEEAKTAFGTLSEPVGVNIEASSLSSALGLARALNAELAKIGPGIKNAAANAASTLTAGGEVRRTMRGLQADTGN